MLGFISAISRGGAIVGLVLSIIAPLKQLIVAVGLLVAIIKLAIIVIFVAVLIMIAYAIYRDHKKHKAEV